MPVRKPRWMLVALAAAVVVAGAGAIVFAATRGSEPGSTRGGASEPAAGAPATTSVEEPQGMRPQGAADCRGAGGRTRILSAAEARRGRPFFALEQVADELVTPLYLTTNAAEPDLLYVVLQNGRVVVVDNGQVRGEPFLDLLGDVDTINENGLLSLAFHPDYARNGLFYVVYNDTNFDLRVVEYRAEEGVAVPGSARVLLLVRKVPGVTWHNGGQLQFGPDGALYVSFGDSAHTPLSAPPAPRTDPDNQAQDLATRYGKIFRLDVNEQDPQPELVAYGLRNPWRFSFDPVNGDLYIADVGFHVWEEIDYLRAGTDQVVNFGWSPCEGPEPFRELDAPEPGPPPNRLDESVPPTAPALAYRHESPDYCDGPGSITGGYVYRGDDIPALRGRYVFGDFCSGEIWTMRMRDGEPTDVRAEDVTVPSLSSFGVDSEGELYAVSLQGQIHRLVPAGN